ncbi:MAG: methylated-DNA-[protein]-cysteine S-methyltransferase [Thermoanaerobacter sp.]|jgi:methylated-DNA-[protein]-cysteine S-methyltransferase|nr:methylated-DNA-[protein]-cysteine S-methyltransferase [Thermoanaerobacter sp.]
MGNIHLLPTVAGWVGTAWSERGLVALTFPRPHREGALAALRDESGCGANCRGGSAAEEWLSVLEERLNRYFRGQRVSFTDIPVDFSLYRPFTARVLEIVRRIGYGQLWSYRQVAEAAGYPGAARAAGGAVRANRVPLVIPCHRVICSDGSPGGFGGGLPLKQWLLELEGVRPGPAGRYQLTNGPVMR